MTWLIGGCRTLATPEQFKPVTLEATKPTQLLMTATLIGGSNKHRTNGGVAIAIQKGTSKSSRIQVVQETIC